MPGLRPDSVLFDAGPKTIHAAIFCDKVCNGEGDGDYLCGHCFAVAGSPAPAPPPAGGEEDWEDYDDSSEDVPKKRRKTSMGAQQQPHGEVNARKQNCCKQKCCKQCGRPGHNKRSCPELEQQRAK